MDGKVNGPLGPLPLVTSPEALAMLDGVGAGDSGPIYNCPFKLLALYFFLGPKDLQAQ